MSYTPKFTTKAFVASQSHIIDEADISDEILEAGENYVLAELLANSKYSETNYDASDFRLKMAATHGVLHRIQVTGVVRGYFGMSGEIASKGAGGVQTTFTSQDRGGREHAPAEIDRTDPTPNNWHEMLRWVRLYLKDSSTGGKRIDLVTMMSSNMNESRVKNMINNKQYNYFKPRS